ncbi:trigger factor [Nitrospira sp.]|nr:trigger factor [Nitrospira sp.]
MKVEMTELGPMKRALKIEVPETEVNERFKRAYTALNRQVQVPGFRPGKAPLALLEKRYAKDVEEDVVRNIVPEYYDRAVKEAGIVPLVVDIPAIDRVKIKKDAPFSFTATVEIRPKIELRDYRPPNPISLKPDTRSVTDEQIDKALEVMREQHAQLHAAPADATLSDGDFAVVDIQGYLDQAPLDGTYKQGHLHRMGSKVSVLGLDLDQALMGKSEGSAVDISQDYPATHPDERVAGKTVRFHATIQSVKRKQLPALDDEFAKDCGPYETLDALRDKLRTEMERALKRDVEQGYKDQIMKRLLETHHFDLPETLVEREVSAMVRHQLHARQKPGSDGGAAPTVRPEELQKLRDDVVPEASRRVKLGLILDTIAEREHIQVEEGDIQLELQRMATELKLDPKELLRLIQAGGQESLNELRSRILADKALDFVYRHAVIQG